MKAEFVPAVTTQKPKTFYLLCYVDPDNMAAICPADAMATSDCVVLDHVPTPKDLNEYRSNGEVYLGYVKFTM